MEWKSTRKGELEKELKRLVTHAAWAEWREQKEGEMMEQIDRYAGAKVEGFGFKDKAQKIRGASEGC